MKNIPFYLLALTITFLSSSCRNNNNPFDNCPGEYEPYCNSYQRFMPFTNRAEVHAIGIYESETESCWKYHPEGQINVNISKADTAYILVLMAYEPIRWNLNFQSQASRDSLAGIILSGYYCQDVANLPDSTPIVNRSQGGGSYDYFYCYEDTSSNYQKMLYEVQQLTQSPVTSFFGRYTGRWFDVQ